MKVADGFHGGARPLDHTLGSPGDSPNGTLVTEIDLDVSEVSTHGYAFRDGHFSGRWTWRDHAQGYRSVEFEIRRFVARKGEGTLSLSGRMRQGGLLDVVAVGDHISFRRPRAVERVDEGRQVA